MMKLSATVAALVLASMVFSQAGAAQWQQAAIRDPVLNMPAWTVTAPANWSVEGTMLPGSSCNSATSPIYHLESPDHQSGVYFLPRADWVWGAGVRSSNDCLPWQGPMSAKRFLTYVTQREKVGFVREIPVPELNDVRSMHGETTDIARYLVRYSVRGQLVDEILTDNITCSTMVMAVVGEQHSCSAFVTRWYAPAGKLEPMEPTFKAIHLTLDQQWWSAWQSALVNRYRTLTEEQTSRLLDQGRLAQAQRMQAHQAYMASATQGYAIERDRFRAGQFAKQSHSDDFVDYILDCQRVYSGATRVSVGANCPNRQTP